MDIETIKQELYSFIREKFEIGDDPDFTTDVNLFDYGFVDSFGAVEITMFAEDKYGVSITQKDLILYPMNSIDEIAQVVVNKL